MGLGWIAIGLLAFRWIWTWFNKRLRESRDNRQRRLREWMNVEDDSEGDGLF